MTKGTANKQELRDPKTTLEIKYMITYMKIQQKEEILLYSRKMIKVMQTGEKKKKRQSKASPRG